MNITNAQYMNYIDTDEVCSIKATIEGVEMFVPLSSSNRHYIEIMRQVDAGTLTIADAD